MKNICVYRHSLSHTSIPNPCLYICSSGVARVSLATSVAMTFWCEYGFGSGSADPCLWLIDPDTDPDPAIFVGDLKDANKKLIFFFKKSFSA
jgi:hypothetical protein